MILIDIEAAGCDYQSGLVLIGNEILGMTSKGINLLDPFLYFISYAVYRLGCQQTCKDGCIPLQVDINVYINEYTMQDIHKGPYMAIRSYNEK